MNSRSLGMARLREVEIDADAVSTPEDVLRQAGIAPTQRRPTDVTRSTPVESGRVRPRLVGINHVALQVDDLEEAVAFYTDLFQPTSVDRSEQDAAFLEMGDQFLALFERGSREEEAHFGLVVDDKEAAKRALEEAGVQILPGQRVDFRDQSGNRVQIVQYDQIQFTKSERILQSMGVDVGKTEAAAGELRAKGLAE